MRDQHVGHLRDFFRGAGGEIRGGESETAVGACVVRLEVKGHRLFPPARLAQVDAVHPHEPVGTGNHLHHQGQLWIRQRQRGTEFVWASSVLQRLLDVLTTLCGDLLVFPVRTEPRSKQQRQSVLCFTTPTSLTHLNDLNVLLLHLMVQLQSNRYSK